MIGVTTTLGYADTENGSYTDLAEITEITFPEEVTTAVDKSNLAISDYFKLKEPGMIDPGEIEVKTLWIGSRVTTLVGLRRTTKWWRIRFPLETGQSVQAMWKAQGFITALGPSVPMDDKVEITLKIALSGIRNFTTGS